MKKVLSVLIVLLMFATAGECGFGKSKGGRTATRSPLRDLTTGEVLVSEDTLATGYMDTGEVIYTQGVDISKAADDAMGLNINLTAGSPDIDITWEYSADGNVYFTPDYTAISAGGLTTSSSAVTDDTMIMFDPVPAKYVRFKFDADAPTGIESSSLLFVRED